MVPVFLSEGKFILATLIGYYQVVSSEFKVDISLFRQPSQNKGQILSVDSQVSGRQFNNQVFCRENLALISLVSLKIRLIFSNALLNSCSFIVLRLKVRHYINISQNP